MPAEIFEFFFYLVWRWLCDVLVAMCDLVGPVSHLMDHRLRISPQPGKRPKHPAKNQGEQAKALDGSCLRVLFLLRNFLRENMNQKEDDDSYNGRYHKHHPRKHVGDFVECLAVENRGVRMSRRQSHETGNEPGRSQTPPIK